MTLLFYAPEQLNGNLSENISVLSRFTSQSPAVCPCHYIPLDLHFLGTSLLSADLRSPWVFSSVLLSLLFQSMSNIYVTHQPTETLSTRDSTDTTIAQIQSGHHQPNNRASNQRRQDHRFTPRNISNTIASDAQIPTLSLFSLSPLLLHVLWHEQTRQYPSFRSLQPLLQQAPRKSSQ